MTVSFRTRSFGVNIAVLVLEDLVHLFLEALHSTQNNQGQNENSPNPEKQKSRLKVQGGQQHGIIPFKFQRPLISRHTVDHKGNDHVMDTTFRLFNGSQNF